MLSLISGPHPQTTECRTAGQYFSSLRGLFMACCGI